MDCPVEGGSPVVYTGEPIDVARGAASPLLWGIVERFTMRRGVFVKRLGELGLGLVVAITSGWTRSARADVELPAIFSPHMVLQRDRSDRVWGHASPGEDVIVTIAHQTKSTKADDKGHWSVMLDPLPAGGPHTLTIKGNNTIALDDVL